jgi:hypothetical protein
VLHNNRLERPDKVKHSSLSNPCVSLEKNEVLWLWTLDGIISLAKPLLNSHLLIESPSQPLFQKMRAFLIVLMQNVITMKGGHNFSDLKKKISFVFQQNKFAISLSRVYIGKGYVITPATATVTTYLPWPPWAYRHKYKWSYLCHVAQGGEGKYNCDCLVSLLPMKSLYKLRQCKQSINHGVNF